MVKELSETEKVYNERWQGILFEEIIRSMSDTEINGYINNVISRKMKSETLTADNLIQEKVVMLPMRASIY